MRAPRVLLAALVLVVAWPAFGADPLVVSTGQEGGSYFFIGQRLKREMILRNLRPPKLLESQGSLENLERLNDPKSPVNLALAQADAVRSFLQTHPEFASRFFVLGDMGRECVLLITAKRGGVGSAADLRRGAGGSISVGGPGSGAALTYGTLVALDPDFGATPTVFTPVMEALVQLQAGHGFSDVKAAMLVQRPTRASPPIRSALDAPDSLRFVEFAEGDVPNATLPDGSAVYSFERIRVGGTSVKRPQEIDTFCTRGLLLGSQEKLGFDDRQGLARLMGEARQLIAGGTP